MNFFLEFRIIDFFPLVIQNIKNINDLISFIILGFVIFMVVRYYNRLTRKPEEEPAPTTKVCPECAMEIPVDARKCPYCSTPQDH